MALNGLLDVEISVKDPAALGNFWERRGLVRTADGVYGTPQRPTQFTFKEGDHRHLSALHLSCANERDIADIKARLASIGVESTTTSTSLRCTDPVLGHGITIDVGAPAPISGDGPRPANPPGAHGRLNSRAAHLEPPHKRPPRRIGHVVLGSPQIAKSTAFYFDALGFRISDQFVGASATFGRVETDHHNLLLHRARVGHLNHYAVEMDDIDAIGEAGTSVMNEDAGAHVVGVGRHFLGSNMFWYMHDPAGNLFEFFCDMDQITNDDEWAANHRGINWGEPDHPAPLAAWGPPPPESFFKPDDIDEIAKARERRGLP